MQMETSVDEKLENSPVLENVVAEQNFEASFTELSNHGGTDSELVYPSEEVRGTLETSASTGKFWLDWEKLRSILSYYLKQVISEYPEAKMTSEQQTSSLGETFNELVKRLNNALHRFDKGPPFTLQRICEILLSARSAYPKLSKLSLALEKNLLVTSTLTVSTSPNSPSGEPKSDRECIESCNAQPGVENGVEEAATGDKDEIMTEVEETEVEAEVDEDMTIDMETIEDIVTSSEANPSPKVDQ